jgi:hypothetical protein
MTEQPRDDLRGVAAASALWQRLQPVLEAEAEAAIDSRNGEAVDLPLKLDLVPLLTQLMLDTGALTREHVWYQSSERLLLGAIGLADNIPAEQHATLRRFCSKLSSRDLHLFHGQGAATSARATDGGSSTDGPPADPAQYMARNNFGAFSERTRVRHRPAHPPPGSDVVLPDVLNLFEGARLRGARAAWAPRHGAHKKNIALVLTFDGMGLGTGAHLEAETGEVWGFAASVRVAEARTYLEGSEREQASWRREHALVDEAVEVLGQVGDGSVVGHVGYWLQPKGLTGDDVARRLAPFLRKVGHVCEGCMLWGYETGADWTAILARCDLHCSQCALTSPSPPIPSHACHVHEASLCCLCRCDATDPVGGACPLHGRHYTERACSACIAKGVECVQFVILMVVGDSGGSQGGLIRKLACGTEVAGVAVFDTHGMTDTPHDVKSAVRTGMCNNSVRCPCAALVTSRPVPL